MNLESLNGLHNQHGGFDVSWSYTPEDLEVARKAFSLITGGDPRRALRLDAVLRWPEPAWAEFDAQLGEIGFDRTNPGRLAALQWLIDQVYEDDAKKPDAPAFS